MPHLSTLRVEPTTVLFLCERCSWAFLFSCFFKPVCQGVLRTIVQNTSSFAVVDFADFAMSESIKQRSKATKLDWKWGLLSLPGDSGQTWGPVCSQDGQRLRHATKKPWKSSQVSVQKGTRISFSWSCSFVFFGLLTVPFFMVLGARDLHFGSLFSFT